MSDKISPREARGVIFRTKGRKNNVKIEGYDDKYVKIRDTDGLHFVPKDSFTTDYFMELK